MCSLGTWAHPRAGWAQPSQGELGSYAGTHTSVHHVAPDETPLTPLLLRPSGPSLLPPLQWKNPGKVTFWTEILPWLCLPRAGFGAPLFPVWLCSAPPGNATPPSSCWVPGRRAWGGGPEAPEPPAQPGLLVLHYHLDFAQTHLHGVSDTCNHLIFHRLLSPPALNLSQIRVFSNELALSIRWPKY